MLIAAALIITAAIYLMVRRVDVRLVLLGAGLAMALLAGRPLAIAGLLALRSSAGRMARDRMAGIGDRASQVLALQCSRNGPGPGPHPSNQGALAH